MLAGRGEVRDEAGVTEVGAGDAFFFPPGAAHQIRNSGDADLVYYVIADNPPGEWCYYPDSRKWNIYGASGRTILQGQEVDYFAGEE